LLDKDFHILWVNEIQSDWFGAKKNICGRHCYETFEHRSHICRGCPTVKVFATGATHKAKRIGITQDGHRRYYQLTVSPIKDSHNRVAFALELVQDVTETIVREKQNVKILHRLKDMYKHISSVNRKLRHNMQRLEAIAGRMARVKSMISKKYQKKMGELALMKEELKDIFKVNHVLSSSVDLKKISGLVTRLTCELTHSQACVLRLLDENRKVLLVDSSCGLSDLLRRQLPILKVGESICGKAVEAKKPLIVKEIEKDRRIKDPGLLIKEGYRSILCLPVGLQKHMLGVISVFSKEPNHFREETVEILDIFASQVAIALQESRHYEDIHKNYFDTIHALVLAIEARDPYTRGHTARVTKYAIEIGRMLQMHKEELEILRYAGEVHDVGKISIPDFILNKPGRLTPAERAIIELHPVKGAEMLEPLEFLDSALPIVRHHHERYDGTGYPDGLEKERIPVMARILACADAFDAMTSDRPYRNNRMTVEQALVEIKNHSGSQFDPHIAGLFIKIIRRQSA
jgi:HD-GYP domain-containing protein (c-di-GMP phosphodiesterase class II)